jgi:hypothetical protein
MRRTFSLLLVALLLILLMSPALSAGDITVQINGKIFTFDPSPLIKDGRTLVPMRAMFEALGAEVQWDEVTRTAIGIRGNIEVRIPIDSTRPTINNWVKEIDVPAMIIEGRTFIPLRFVSEALGDEVYYDSLTRTISITKQEQLPDVLPPSVVPPPPPPVVSPDPQVHQGVGTLKGVLLCSSGSAQADVQLVAIPKDSTKETKYFKTKFDGTFTLLLDAGYYDLRVSSPPDSPPYLTNILIRDGQVTVYLLLRKLYHALEANFP